MSLFEATVLSVNWDNNTAKIRLRSQPKLVHTARLARHLWTKGATTKVASVAPETVGEHGAHAHGEHSHVLADALQAGDVVYVGMLNGRNDSPVVLAQK